ncbi:MAG: thioesterase family protein, partial [Halobacteriota archaeon]
MVDAGAKSVQLDGLSWLYEETVRPEWVDYNGHMNVAYYVLVFDHATDAALDRLDVGEAHRRRTGCSVFVGETHVNYRQEVLQGDALTVGTSLLGVDERRLVLFHEMTCCRLATAIASNEVLCVHVDLGTRRPAPWPASAVDRLAGALAAHSQDSPPKDAGRAIRLSGCRV